MSEYRPGPASLHTRLIYERSFTELPFFDRQDHADAVRGHLAELPGGSVGAPAAALDATLDGREEVTHPSLRRIMELRRISGLFEVVPGVHQIRGLGTGNVTAIASDNGRILVDPPASRDLAATAVELLDRHLGARPVVAALGGGSTASPDRVGRVVIDGVAIDSLPVRDAHAADVLLWFPDLRMLHASSSVRHSLPPLHDNAGLRDPLSWSKALHGVLVAHQNDLAVVVATHDWPTWGNAAARQLIADHRDLLRFVHDEVLRLTYQGHSVEDVIARLRLPPTLETRWHARGYDSTVDAHVRLLHARTAQAASERPPWVTFVPQTAASRFLSWAGGVGGAVDQLGRSFDDGDYRWVVQAGELVLTAEPGAAGVREMTAMAYEQLAYQEENMARRLLLADRAKLLASGGDPRAPELSFCVAHADVERLMDHLAVRVVGPRASRQAMSFRWDVIDHGASYVMSLHNGVLFASRDCDRDQGAAVASTRAVLADIACGHVEWESAVQHGAARIDGDRRLLDLFFGLLDPWPCPLHSERSSSTNHHQRLERP